MMKIAAGVFLAILIGVIAYMQFNTGPLDSKAMLENAVKQVKDEKGDITPEQEAILRVQIAVADYTASTKRAPKKMAELVPKYFESIPVDPRSGQPMEFPLDKAVGEAPTPEDPGKIIDTDAIVIDGQNFLNPNTMVIDDFVYDPAGRRDPFQPFDFSGASEINMDLPPLERYAVGQLKLTSILSAGNDFSAIIEDPTGRGYTARRGTKVGNAKGVVVKITEDSVFVVETRTDFTGKTVRETVQMKIQRVATDLDGQATYNRKIMNSPK